MEHKHVWWKNPRTTVVNKQYRKHIGSIYIGRPSKYGNPFKIGRDGSREEVLEKYENYLNATEQEALRKDMIIHLQGKVLACWCKPKKCHGDIIARIVDRERESLYFSKQGLKG